MQTKPALQVATLVTLTFGATPTVVRYTNWTENIVLGSDTFLSETTLEVELGQQHGGTEDKPSKLTIASGREPFNRLITGYRHARVVSKVEEIVPGNSATRRVLHYGSIGFVTRNPNGKPGIVRADLIGLKARIAEVRGSIPMTSTCDHIFNSDISLCRVVGADAWKQLGTVSGIHATEKNVVICTLPGVSSPAVELAAERFRRGRVTVDGLSLQIKKSREDGSFEMFGLIPPWWVGANCEVSPGCDGRIESCRLWNNENNFRGLGIKIPARNPVFEEAE